MRLMVRLFMILLAALVVGVGLLFLLPSDRIARIASQQISAATGREVVMEGDTAISFYPVLGVSAGSFTIANADWSDSGPMFSAQNLKIGVEPQALWGGEVKITGLEAANPLINLERAADGRVNWELGVEGVAASGQGTAAPEEAAPSAPAQDRNLALTLDRALITNASFHYTDLGTGQKIRMDGMDFDLRWPNISERADFDITLRPAGDPVRLRGQIAALDRFIEGDIVDLTIDISAPGGTLDFAGSIGAAPEAEGALEADIADTARLMGALGLAGADIPEGLGRAITAESRVTLSSDQRLSLRELVMRLDQNRMTGAIDVALAGPKPKVTAQLDAGDLDLSGLTQGEGGDAGASGASGNSTGTGHGRRRLVHGPHRRLGSRGGGWAGRAHGLERRSGRSATGPHAHHADADQFAHGVRAARGAGL
jgi:AsmA protein